MTLRAPEPEDIDFIYSVENDPERLLHGRTGLPVSRAQISEYICRYSQNALTADALRLIIEDNHRAMGIIDLYDMDMSARKAFVAIYIVPESRGRGLGLSALNEMLETGFNQFGLNQIIAVVGRENHPSLKLFDKAGFVQICELRQWVRNSDGHLGSALLLTKFCSE